MLSGADHGAKAIGVATGRRTVADLAAFRLPAMLLLADLLILIVVLLFAVWRRHARS